MKRNLKQRYGQWAVVTGASSGIGDAYARRLAEEGFDLVVVARRGDRLESLAEDLMRRHGIEVRAVEADLSTPHGVDAIDKATADVEVGLVVSNAGATRPGSFLSSAADVRLANVALNVSANVQIAHQLGERLVSQGRGALVFTGSTSAFAGVPYLADYAAAKAFVGTFTEGLAAEWRPKGVDVMVVHPGPTRTEMVETEGADMSKVPANWMEPEKVVDIALRSLGRRTVVLPGVANKVQRFVFTRLLSRRRASKVWGGLMGRVTDDRLK